MDAILAEADRLMAAGDSAGCRDLLLAHDQDEFTRTLQPRYAVVLARAHLQLDEPWKTYLVLRDFADDHPHSELRDEAIELQYTAGKTLGYSNRGFLFFWSDRRRSQVTLEHLITRYPDCIYLADALRLLGEMAFEDGDFARAEERYRELMRRRPESEWVGLARFRFAMSITGSLRGPEYDLEKMQLAITELRAFLANPPENPTFVKQAQAASRRLLTWQADRHLLVAEFYARVGNRFGEVRGLRRAAAAEFAECEATSKARQRLEALGEPVVQAPEILAEPPR